jgi:hypothetical protein
LTTTNHLELPSGGDRVPTFDTPNPIAATINVAIGDVRISAAERSVTNVTVVPTDSSKSDDRKAAELTRVDYRDGRLLVQVPKLRALTPTRSGGSIDVTVELPAGSRVHGSGALADFAGDGPLGECRLKIGVGQIRLDEAGPVTLKTGIGDISIERATGHADITSGSGEVRVRALDASAVIKNSNGDTWVGAAHGDLRVGAANGNVGIDVADAGVVAKSSNGDVRVGEAVRSSVVLETKLGDLEVGIREGTAAWLDVRSGAGTVHNGLEAAAAPSESSTEVVEVRARTSAGDVLIGRA